MPQIFSNECKKIKLIEYGGEAKTPSLIDLLKEKLSDLKKAA